MYRYVYQRRQSSIEEITEGMDRLQLQPPSTPSIMKHKKIKLVLEKEDEEGMDFVFAEEDEDEDDDNEAKGEKSGPKEPMTEKKAKRLMKKLGIEPVTGVHKITAKKEDSVYVFSSPTVYVNPTYDTYFLFGKAQILNEKSSKEQSHKESKTTPGLGELLSEVESENEEDLGSDEEEVDESGLNPLDIQLVMNQTGLTWDKAAKALKDADNDFINAIMEQMNF